jgi:hypothetical protein
LALVLCLLDEHLLCKCKALSSSPSPTQKEEEEEEEEEILGGTGA